MSDRLVLTLKQAAEELGVSERTVAGLVARREIPGSPAPLVDVIGAVAWA